jgi:hypothetical protein
MKHKRTPIIVLCLALAASSLMCSIFTPSDSIKPTSKEKQATLENLKITVSAMEKEAVTATPAPTVPVTFSTLVKPPTGSISGKLSYPSESIPPLRIVAFNVETGEVFATEAYEGGVYGLQDLSVGTYHVIAYPVDRTNSDPNLAGGYTRFVLCGLMVSCTDHTLMDVRVEANTVTADVNPGDWNAPAGSFPPDPLRK